MITTTASQWRLAAVEVANWGTFDGEIHHIPVSREGHLITGPSGSGKSSLLDGIAAVLIPDKWLRFNQAAQGPRIRGDDRDLVSYVRGAWSRTANELEDRIESAFLRSGTTWSGVLLRFEQDADAAPLVLARLFFLQGSKSARADLRDLRFLERGDATLLDLEPYARTGLKTRPLQQDRPDAIVTTSGKHQQFISRMRSQLGIKDETSLRLLHKTQSAKHLDNLDHLFREYMLERPETFAFADNAVEQFGELRDAHDHVVMLQQQRDHLLKMQAVSRKFDEAADTAASLSALIQHVRPYQLRRAFGLMRDEQRQRIERAHTLQIDVQRTQSAMRQADDHYRLTSRRALELGGGLAEQLHDKLRSAQVEAEATATRWRRLRDQLAEVGINEPPTTAAEHAELRSQIEHELASPGTPGPSHEQSARYFTARTEIERLDRDIKALRHSGVTVPDALLRIRHELATALHLPENVLLFAAELIEVRPEYRDWTGAIERVLRSFALTLLVRTEQLAAARRWVETHRIHARLVFEEVRTDAPTPRPARAAKSLVHRVAVAPGPFARWVEGQLSERFDMACVDHVDELDHHVRAVTISGQIKSSRTRYEKDDRIDIDDRQHWILGDKDAKLETLIERRRTAQTELAAAEAEVKRAEMTRDRDQRRRGALAALRQQEWAEVDRDHAELLVTEIETQLVALTRNDAELRDAVEQEQESRRLLEAARNDYDEARIAQRQHSTAAEELADEIASVQAALERGEIPEVDAQVTATLDARFAAEQRRITRQQLADVGQRVITLLHDERDAAQGRSFRLSNEFVVLAGEFGNAWPAAMADLTPTIDDRHGFLELLTSILNQGLPEHVENFQRLLRERSTDLVGNLVNEILAAPREIEERVAPVNSSLLRSEFDAERFLRLRVKVSRNATVAQFISDLRSVSEGSWLDDDLESAQRRFTTLAEVMRRFGSSDAVDRRWREQCLDTRMHVTFLAEEIDADGRVHATYDSGAAMSGGQQQKLAFFCLAAALRFQLADTDDAVPKYGTVLLDEAFDKADARYTRMVLDVFREFGFHLVLATPQKLLQTIEPYIGAATSVENPSRRKSVPATVVWEQRGEVSEPVA
ncbi:hypothetical protein EG850_04450 [Gulosibacter macacae]|uniref:ATP-binding protein n=1 Tax=Gulosibacter macacae TaxID=2488791 RepID=A0A3P3VZ90_9MICO|nr:SbcC/MukB-like Walker B domain-containing protein [Gulosibacter macacae]RRJ87557.1 hypothetical protein EG850_04450 [Gulosibacter macacae]